MAKMTKILLFIIIYIIATDTFASDIYSVFTDTVNSRLKQSGISKDFFDQRFQNQANGFTPVYFNAASEKPLDILNSAREFDSAIYNFSKKPEYVFDFFRNTYRMKDYADYKFSSSLPRDYIENKLGVNLEKNAGFIGSKLLTQYVSALILALNALDKDALTNNIELLNFLTTNRQFLHDIYVKNKIFMTEDEKLKIDKLINQLFKSGEFLKKSDIFSIAQSFFKVITNLNNSSEDNIRLFQDSIKTTVFETKIGKIAIGGNGDDYYKGNFVFIIDIGGNDTYLNNRSDLKSALSYPIRCIIDFDGNDIYSGRNFCYGGSIFGINILIDKSGNDTYHAEDHSLGSSLFGVGILIDEDGNDFYNASSFSLGFGFFGMGILIDNSGNDIYRGAAFSMASSVSGGIGALADKFGNDRYIAENLKSSVYAVSTPSFTIGSSKGPGGFACFIDYSGDDKYDAQNWAVGSSMNNAAGIFIDKAGDDLYYVSKNSIAYSDIFSISLFADHSGDDKYFSATNSFGIAGKNSTALFLEAAGNDIYHTSKSVRDKPQANSFSVFADLFGNDSYNIPGRNNYILSFPARPLFSFLDIISDANVKNDNINVNTFNSIYPAIDKLSFKWQFKTGDNSKFRSIEGLVNHSLQNYYSTEYRSDYYSDLNSNVSGIINFISTNLNSYDTRINDICTYLLYDLINSKNSEANKFVTNAFKTNDNQSVELLLNVVGAGKFDITLREYERFFNNNDNNIRAHAIRELAYIDMPFLNKDLTELINNDDRNIRLNSVFAFANVYRDSLSLITDLLKKAGEQEQEAALYGLMKNPEYGINYIIKILKSIKIPKIRQKYYILLSYMSDFQKQQRKLRTYIISLPVRERKILYNSLSNNKTDVSVKIIKYMQKRETNKELKYLLNQIK